MQRRLDGDDGAVDSPRATGKTDAAGKSTTRSSDVAERPPLRVIVAKSLKIIRNVVCVSHLSGNALTSINVVALRQARLLPGWVTVCGRVNHVGM